MRSTVAHLSCFTPGIAAAWALAAVLSGCHANPTPARNAGAAPVASRAARMGDAECPVGRRVVWRGRFDEPRWLAAWDPRARFDYGDANADVVMDVGVGRKVLRVHYPAGSSSRSYAREGHPLGGLEFKARLPGTDNANSLFLSYWLKFDPSFRWVRGGKLPGLCGGRCPSGGAVVTGEGGWSVRSMWRPGGAGEAYAYILPSQAYGTELGLGAWTFTTGSWHRIGYELTLNTGDKNDGVLRVWYDAEPTSKPTFEATGLSFRRDATGATTLFFSTFYGGHDASWATPVDTFVDFAEFTVCR